jgi:putative FmdB family regulatory protein
LPTYQYVCTACDEPLEAVQAFTDAALTECPSCGGRLRKVFTSVGVVFKGSGFYRTDSRDAAKVGANGAGKESTDAKAPESTSSSDAKGSDTTAKPANDGARKKEKTPAAATTS